MEQAKRVTLADGTRIEADPMRPYNRFLKLETAGVTARFSLTDAAAIYEVLHAYFAQPEVREAHGQIV